MGRRATVEWSHQSSFEMGPTTTTRVAPVAAAGDASGGARRRLASIKEAELHEQNSTDASVANEFDRVKWRASDWRFSFTGKCNTK